MLLIRRALRIMNDFIHALRMREVVFGREMEWVCGMRDGEVSPGDERGRHLLSVDELRDGGGDNGRRLRERRWGKESL
jgi:hypothetical protein